MHEATLAFSIVRIVQEEAVRCGVERLSRVVVRVGVFAGVETYALQAAFAMAAEGTRAEGAELCVERVSATGVCVDCSHTFNIQRARAVACPSCGSARFRMTGGHECLVQQIDAYLPTHNTATPQTNSNETCIVKGAS